VFGGAIAGSISTSFGLRNFVSSSRPCPSGVRIITMSTWTPSSPLTRSTDGPSTGASPSSVMPSVVKKAIAAARSSTTTLTWSNLFDRQVSATTPPVSQVGSAFVWISLCNREEFNLGHYPQVGLSQQLKSLETSSSKSYYTAFLDQRFENRRQHAAIQTGDCRQCLKR
jgi:hypothetical protein